MAKEKTKDAVFLAPLLEMWDDEYNTVAGFKDQDSQYPRDLLLIAFGKPYSEEIIRVPSVLTVNTSDVTALKAKHYIEGITACFFINKYLEALEKTPKSKAQYFVDPASWARGTSREMVHIGSWIIFMRDVIPRDYFFESRKDLAKDIGVIVGNSIKNLMSRKPTAVKDMDVVRADWREYAEKFYIGLKEKVDAEASEPTPEEVELVGLTGARYYIGAAVPESEVKHIIRPISDEALCGLPVRTLLQKSWIRGAHEDKTLCPKCAETAKEMELSVVEPEEAEQIEVFQPEDTVVYYVSVNDAPKFPVHLAPDRYADALCGADSQKHGGIPTWDYIQQTATVCEECQAVAAEGQRIMLEHDDAKPIQWVKFPGNLFKIHLATTGISKTLCGTEPPKTSWSSADECEGDERFTLCPACVSAADAEDRTFPLRFSDKVEEIIGGFDDPPTEDGGEESSGVTAGAELSTAPGE
jgi:hypothetical protein